MTYDNHYYHSCYDVLYDGDKAICPLATVLHRFVLEMRMYLSAQTNISPKITWSLIGSSSLFLIIIVVLLSSSLSMKNITF